MTPTAWIISKSQLIEKFESRSFVWTNPSELNSDTLLQSYCDIQAENRLLHLLLQDLNDKTNKTSPSAAAPSVGVAAAIQRVQKALVRQSGEQKLAETVYKSSHMPYNKFSNATRGILLMKRVGTRKAGHSGTTVVKHKWKKRWILLQNDFLFCYRPDSVNEEPVATILLTDHRIVLKTEQDIGKKHGFMLTSGRHNFYFAAAKLEIQVRWLTALGELTPWFYTGNEELEKVESQEEAQPDIARMSAKRSVTVPSLSRNRSKKKLAVSNSETAEPFPGIALKVSEEDNSPFPGIRLRTESSRNRDSEGSKRLSRSPQPQRR
eukprot:CAMPEP_0206206346 /NCGR_PEP_ID=MMETSP0166-20121206/14860_1 /ASSEMBLY_ACC=CAM_ASM_000260 /TAXON_ID=95228 /ORGANISM="Vannella robusta, Strain DIVA3 518/3/11/1/6" /LENGTH=320 /DNA_ID=CAMNT_0053626737 /DNA_START=83 /DNA_END=1045 /DNA_ORIENTATION=-